MSIGEMIYLKSALGCFIDHKGSLVQSEILISLLFRGEMLCKLNSPVVSFVRQFL